MLIFFFFKVSCLFTLAYFVCFVYLWNSFTVFTLNFFFSFFFFLILNFFSLNLPVLYDIGCFKPSFLFLEIFNEEFLSQFEIFLSDIFLKSLKYHLILLYSFSFYYTIKTFVFCYFHNYFYLNDISVFSTSLFIDKGLSFFNFFYTDGYIYFLFCTFFFIIFFICVFKLKCLLKKEISALF